MILVALLVPVLLAMIGLAVDGSRAEVASIQLQSTSDAAALAAANTIAHCTGTASACQSQANSAAGAVVVQNGLPASAVTVTYVTNGDGSTTAQAVVNSSQNTYFMRAVGTSSVSLSSAAGAKAMPPAPGTGSPNGPSGPFSSGCGVCVINPNNVAATFSVSGSPIPTFSGGNVMVDGTSSTSLSNSSTSTVTGTNGANFGVSGGYTGSFSPTPISGAAAPAINDPWSNIPYPNSANDPWATTYTCSSPPCDGSNSGSTAVTLNPGVYSKITNTGSGGITLNPGIYIVTGAFGGNASVQTCRTCGGGGGTDSQITGTGGDTTGPYIYGSGVLLYLTCPSTQAPYYTPCTSSTAKKAGYVDLEGSNTLSLSPYQCSCSSTSSGYLYNNMSIIYDPQVNLQAKIVGNGSDTLSGGIYLPLAQLYLSGSSGSLTLTNTQIVVNEIQIDGSASVSISTTNIASTGSSGGSGSGSGSTAPPNLIT